MVSGFLQCKATDHKKINEERILEQKEIAFDGRKITSEGTDEMKK